MAPYAKYIKTDMEPAIYKMHLVYDVNHLLG